MTMQEYKHKFLMDSAWSIFNVSKDGTVIDGITVEIEQGFDMLAANLRMLAEGKEMRYPEIKADYEGLLPMWKDMVYTEQGGVVQYAKDVLTPDVKHELGNFCAANDKAGFDKVLGEAVWSFDHPIEEPEEV